MKTSEDIRCKEDVSETESRPLLKQRVWRAEQVRVRSVCSEGHASDSLPIFITPSLV